MIVIIDVALGLGVLSWLISTWFIPLAKVSISFIILLICIILPIEKTILTREETRVKLVTIFNENGLSNNIGQRVNHISNKHRSNKDHNFFFLCNNSCPGSKPYNFEKVRSSYRAIKMITKSLNFDCRNMNRYNLKYVKVSGLTTSAN